MQRHRSEAGRFGGEARRLDIRRRNEKRPEDRSFVGASPVSDETTAEGMRHEDGHRGGRGHGIVERGDPFRAIGFRPVTLDDPAKRWMLELPASLPVTGARIVETWQDQDPNVFI